MPKNNIFSKKFLMVLGVLLVALSFVFLGVFTIANQKQITTLSCVVLSTDDGQYYNTLNGGYVEINNTPIGVRSSANVAKGKAVTLSATPNNGYAFVGYFGADLQTPLSLDLQYTFAVEENQSIIAKFAKQVELSLQVQSPLDKEITQTINTTCYVGQNVDIAEIVQANCDETWVEYYNSAMPKPTKENLQQGYTFTQSSIKVGTTPTTVAVTPSDIEYVGASTVPSGYGNRDQVLVMYSSTGVNDYKAVSNEGKTFTLKESEDNYKVYSSSSWNWSFVYYGYLCDYFYAEIQTGYILDYWQIDYYSLDTYYDESWGVMLYRGWYSDYQGDYLKLYPNSLIAGIGSQSVGIIIVKPILQEGYIATFHSDESTVMSQTTHKKNASISLPTAPTKEGFTFAGWTTSPTSNVVEWSEGAHTLSADKDFYPVWKRNNMLTYVYITSGGVRAVVQDSENYSINFSAQEAQAEKTSFVVDQVPNTSFLYEGKQYQFVGFSTDETTYSGAYANASDIVGLVGSIEMYGQAKTLYAIYSTTIYISYDANGGQNAPTQESTTICKSAGAQSIQSQTLQYRLTSQTPTLEDGKIVAWVNNNTQYAVGGIAPISWDITFTAKWLIDHTLPGAGTKSNPYTISSAREYKRFVSGVNDGRYSKNTQYFKLTASFEIGYYEPVGIWDYSVNKAFPFMGNFDGNGQTLTLASTGIWQSTNYVGIFGYNKGTVQNLVVNANIAGENYVGGVCGYNTGKLINCIATVNIESKGSYVGGIVGENIGVIDKCIANGIIINNNTSAQFVGGIAGSNLANSIIRNAIANGTITTNNAQYVGGIAGQNLGKIINTQNSLNAIGAYYVGGIVGANKEGEIYNSYSSGNVYSLNTYAGAIAGHNTGTVQYAYYFANSAFDGNNRAQNAFGTETQGVVVSDPNYVDSFSVEGVNAGVQMENSGRELSLKWALNLGLEFFSLEDGNVYCSWEDDKENGYATLFVDGWNENIGQGAGVTGWTGSGTLTDPYQIGSIGDLQLLQEKVSFGLTYKGAYFAMTYDITFKDTVATEWKPIGGATSTASYIFEGTFDGQGHKISDIIINNTQNYQGVFGYNNGIIRNVVLADANITGGSYVGGLVGYNTGSVMNCTFESGTVSGNGSYIGGIVGVNNGLVDKCISNGATVGKNATFGLAVGGLVGINLSNAVIRNSLHNGAVSGNNYQWLGGIAGQNHGKIINVYNQGSVSGAYYVGGLAGQNGGGTIQNVYTNGSVLGQNTYAGAITGFDNGGEIEFTYYLGGTAKDGKGKAQKGIGNATLGQYTNDIAGEITVFDTNKQIVEVIINGQTTTNLLEALNFAQKYYDSAEEGIYCIWVNDENNFPSLLTNGAWNSTTQWKFQGEGTKGNPYLIATEDDLYYLALYVNSGDDYSGCYFAQTEDITILKYADSWNPIGTYNTKTNTSNFFAGVYDGKYRKITGITTNTSANYQGMFGYNNGTIKNVGLVDTNIVGGSYVGGVVGFNTGSIEDCYTAGQVKATGSYLGGIVGVNNGTINKCYNLGSVVGGNSTFGLAVGGVIGINLSAGIAFNIFNNGTICANAYQWVGGLIGQNHGTIENSFNNGDVNGAYYIGGVVGQNGGGVITLAYNSGKITGEATYAGAVCGFNNAGKISNTFYLASSCKDGSGKAQNGIGCETIGNVSKDNFVESWPFNVDGSMNSIVLNNINVENLGDALKISHARISSIYKEKYCVWEDRDDHEYPATCKTQYTPVLWNGYISKDALEGVGSKNDPYLIKTLEDLENFTLNVNSGESYSGKYIRLMANLNFNGNANNVWSPIGWYDESTDTSNYFSGTFDGNGFTISGLYTNTSKNYQGLFGYNAGNVKNLIVGGTITGGSYVGGIAGYNTGTISYCKNECAVSANGSYVGGIVGVNNGKVYTSYNTGNITGKNATFGLAVGGVAGINLSKAYIENCFSSGNVVATVYQWVGGVVGQNHGKIYSAYSGGSVEGAYYVGGVAGQNGGGIIQNSLSYGNVKGYNTYVGGVCGFNNNGTLEYTFYHKNKAFDGNLTQQKGIGNATLGEQTNDISGEYMSFNANLAISPVEVFGTQTTNLITALNAVVFENRQNGIIGDAWTKSSSGMPIFGYAMQIWNGAETAVYDAGNGSVDNPYQIANAKQFAYFAKQIANGQSYQNKYFVLTNDIYLNHLDIETESANANLWTPINGFAGNFNGQNYAVHGAFVNTIESNAGVFGTITGQIANICTASGFIQGLANVGGIVGYTSGDISKAVNGNLVYGYGTNVGGVAGFASGMMNSCGNSANIVGLGENVGGIVGQNTASVVNSFNHGAIQSQSSCVGGIVGLGAECVVVNCFNTGAVYGTQSIGGIVGHNKGGVQNCYNLGEISGASGYVGGVVGKNAGKVEANYYLLNSASTSASTQFGVGAVAGKSTQDISGTTNYFGTSFSMASVGVGSAVVSNLVDALNTWAHNKQAHEDVALYAWKMGENYPVFERFWNGGQSSSFSGGTGTQNDPYQISTANDLALLSKNVANGTTYTNKYFVMTKDIYLNDELFEFDADTGLVMVSDGVNVAYLGTGIKGATGNNITFDQTASSPGTWYATTQGASGTYGGQINVWAPIGQVSSAGKQYAFAGHFDGDGHVVSGVYINGSGTSQGLFGIVSGIVKSVGVSNSYIAGDMYVAGVVGNTTGTLSNLFNEATVIAKTSSAGGVCGYANANSSLKNAYNSGIVWGNQTSGGVGGQILGTVANIYNWGNAYQATAQATPLGAYTQSNLASNIYMWTNSAKVDSKFSVVAKEDIVDATEALNNFATQNNLLQWRIDIETGKPWFFTNVIWDGSVATGYEGGAGTESNPYLIATASQLAYFASGANRGSYAKIIKDIYLNDESFIFDADTGLIKVTDGVHTAYLGTGVKGDKSGTNTKFDGTASIKGTWYSNTSGTKGSYTGAINNWDGIADLKTSLDGGNFTIYGLYSTTSGLISTLKPKGVVKNIQIASGLSIATKVAGIANSSDGGVIANCFNSNIVMGDRIAGIVSSTTATITYSTSKGEYGGYDVYSHSKSQISNCQNAGVLIGSNVGGIICEAEYIYEFTNCINIGNIYALEKAGGLIQKYTGHYEEENYMLSITNCHNFGVINAGTSAGGIIAYIDCGTNYNQSYTWWWYEWIFPEEGQPYREVRSSSGRQMHNTSRVIISNCTNSSMINGSAYVGGIVGDGNKNQSALFTISSVSNTGVVKGGNYSGGIAGKLKLATLVDSVNEGDVSGLMYTGGVVGHNECSVSNCMNFANVSGSQNVGGILGYTNNVNYPITNVYNFGDVQGNTNVAGIVGALSGAKISYAYTGSTITANSYKAGGIVGKLNSGTLSSCFNTGFVYGTYYVGGIAGNAASSAKFSDCKYGYGMIFATKSTISSQTGIGVDSGLEPGVDISEDIQKFTEDTLIAVKGEVDVIDKDLFFEKVGISKQGGGIYLLENSVEVCLLNNIPIAPKDYGILLSDGQNILMAYKAAASITVYTNGLGVITEENANGWQVDNTGKTASQVVYANVGLGALPQPTDETYTFAGWYKDAECINKPVTEATTYDFSFTKLYAKWVLSTFTMSISLESGEIPATAGWVIADDALSATKTVQVSKTIGDLPELSVPGYKFDGWFADPACTQRITQYTIFWAREDVQIYPKLTLNTFNMTIKLNNNEWEASGINIQIFKVGDVETKVFEATNIQDATFKIDQPFDVGYYRVMASQKATNLENMVQLGALVWVEGETNYIVDYYSLTLTKGDGGINCVYILEENGKVIETEDIHNNAQIYLRGQRIVISAVVAEKDGFVWGDWIDGDTGLALKSGQDLTINSLEKPYVFTAQSR